MITLDLETKSYADLNKVGAWVYSKDPTTEIICACYQIDDEPIQEWWPGKSGSGACPTDLRQALETQGKLIEAHNISFERSMWMNVLTPRYGWPAVPTEQWRDTMAVAAYYALPVALDKLARVLGFGGKDPEGGRLITKYSKLNLKTSKPVIPPEDFRKFVDYCRRDVELERRVSDFLGDLPERELPLFFHDQEINLRGLLLDKRGIAVASEIVDRRSENLTKEFTAITKLKPTQTGKLLVWFNENGIKLENMTADTIEDMLENGELRAGPARRALQIRLEINKASTKKLDAMARNADPDDDRARYQTRYHGAQTGRTTGAGFQPLNLVRGWEDVEPEQLVRDVMHGDADYLDVVYGDAMEAVSKASRHWIVAAPGHRLLAGDFVSVEAVILACLAGEQWKIDAFARKDKIYELMADKIYNLPPGTVTKKTHPLERQDGKTCLGAGTQVLTSGGWKRIVEVSKNDKLWDGEEWVEHDGLIYQGKAETVRLAGVEMTPDHGVLVGQRWVEAGKVALNEHTLSQGLETGSANLPSWVLTEDHSAGFCPCGSSATAGANSTWFQRVTSAAARARVALPALLEKPSNGVKNFLGTQTYAQTTATEGGYLTECLHSLPVVAPAGTETTEAGGYECSSRGATEQKEGESTLPIYSLCLAGITQHWRLIASTLIKATSLGIYSLLSAAKERKDQSPFYNNELLSLKPVYDLVNAGPRRRFTILTNKGPIIVHNCELAFGYQGALNAWLKFDSSGRHTDERIIEICKAWRAEHPMVVKLWAGLEWAAVEAIRTGQRHDYRLIGFEVVDDWLTMIGPDGKRIWYYKPELRAAMPRWHEPELKEDCAKGACNCKPKPQITYMAQKFGQWIRTSTYGGKLTENACQFVSRQYLAPAQLAVEKAGYPVVLTVYDEILAEAPIGFGSKEEFEHIIETSAGGEWSKGWPIRVEAWEGERYKK